MRVTKRQDQIRFCPLNDAPFSGLGRADTIASEKQLTTRPASSKSSGRDFSPRSVLIYSRLFSSQVRNYTGSGRLLLLLELLDFSFWSG